MANHEKLTLDEFLAKYPDCFEVATQMPSSAPSSAVQASAAQPETNQKPMSTSKSKRHPMKDGGYHVDISEYRMSDLCKGPLPIPASHTNKRLFSPLTHSTSSKLPKSGSFGHSSDVYAAIEAAATKAATEASTRADETNAAAIRAAATKASTEAEDIEAEGIEAASGNATPSKSGNVKAEPSLAELIELDRKDDQCVDKEQEQSMSDLLPHLPTSSDTLPTKRRTSPPLGHAIARRTSVLNQPKQKPSKLRNEIYRCPAEDDESANAKGEESRVNASSQEQSGGGRGRSTDKKAIFGFGKESDVAKANKVVENAYLSENAYLPAKSYAQEEGTTKANTTKKEPSSADDDLMVPPTASGSFVKKNSEDLDWPSDIPKPSDISVKFRDPGVGLSAYELLKTPHEFRQFDRDDIGAYWDLAYTPEIRTTVLAFKHKLAQEGITNKELDWHSRLLVELVDAVDHKGAKHRVDASDIKTDKNKESAAATINISARLPDTKNIADTNNINASEHKQSKPTTTEQSAQFSITNISLAAVFEFQQALADQTYDIITRRQIFALYNSVKLDPTLTKILMDCYKSLQPQYSSSNTASVLNNTDKLVAGRPKSMELETHCKGKGKESDLPVEGTAFSPIEGDEKGLAIGSGQGKENDAGNGKVKAKGKKNKGKRKNKGKGKRGSESVMNDETPDKDERQRRDVLMEDSAVDKGQRKDNELPLKGAFPKHPGTSNGSREGHGFSISATETEDLHEKLDVLLEFDMVKDLVSAGVVSKENVREELQKMHITMIEKAKALFLDPQSVGFIKSMGLKPNHKSDSTASNAPPYDPKTLRDLVQFPLTNKEQAELMIFLKVYTLMEDKIRPQTASVPEVNLACDLLKDPMVFAALRPLIQELNWNR